MINVIQEYLASLGFHVDQKSFGEANKALDKIEKKVNAFSKTLNNAVKAVMENKIIHNARKKAEEFLEKIGTKLTTFLMTTRGLVTAAIAGIMAGVAALTAALTAATYKFMANMAKADMAVQVFARRMFTTVENARSLKAVMDTMGIGSLDDLKDIAMNPELRAQFLELRRMSAGFAFDERAQQGMRNIRAVEFEFQKMTLIWNYFLQSLVGELGDVMAGPLSAFRGFLADINAFFASNMKSISHDVAAFLGMFAKLLEMIGRLASLILGLDFTEFGGLLDILGGALDLVNALLDGINSILAGLGQLTKAGKMQMNAGVAALIPSNKDMYNEGKNTFKMLAYYVQRIYELLSQAWGFLDGILKRIIETIKDPVGAAKNSISNWWESSIAQPVQNVLSPAAAASTSGLSGGAVGPGVSRGGRRFNPGVRTSETINNFLDNLEQRFHEAYTVTSGVAGRSGGSLHPHGRGVDLVPRDRSIKGWSTLVKNMLDTPGLQTVNLELTPLRHAKVIKQLDDDGIRYQGRIKRQITKDWTGEHVHGSLRPLQVSIHINGIGKDKHEIAETVAHKIQQVASHRIRSNGGAFA